MSSLAETDHAVIDATVAYREKSNLFSEKVAASVDNFDEFYIQKERASIKMREALFKIYPEEGEVYNALNTLMETATPEELFETQAILRRKYGLLDDLKDYDRSLDYFSQVKKIAEKQGVPLLPKKDYASFFEANPEAEAVFSNGMVFADVDQLWPHRGTLAVEHEVVHEVQHLKYPEMTIAQQEFEANMVNARTLTNDPNNYSYFFPK